MNPLNLLGMSMILLPFVVIFIYVAKKEGFKVAVGIFATTAGIVAIFAVGSYLLLGS